MTKNPLHHIRAAGGKRWNPEDEARLLELVQSEQSWEAIAASMKRTFSSVQARFLFLRKVNPQAASISVPFSTRSKRPGPEPDLSCGALSAAGRAVIDVLMKEVSKQVTLQKLSGPRKISTEAQTIIGAITREVVLSRLNSDLGWLRLTITAVSAVKTGISGEYFRNILSALVVGNYLELHVGYLGVLQLEAAADTRGRVIRVRASTRLIDLYESQGIAASNVFTHFPKLG